MEKHFATYNQSLALKELGFDEPCFGWYHPKGNIIYAITKDKDSIVNAPLKSQVFEWARKEHKLHGNVIIAETNCGFKIQYLSDYINQWFASYESYEEAESACIDKLIELLQHDNNEHRS